MALGNDVTLKVGFDIDKFQAELSKTNGILNTWGNQVKGIATTAIASFAFVDVGKQMIEVTAQFQKFGAILGNTLGSDSQAQKALKEIRQFAIETPFEVAEVTAAYVRWANMGLTPTIDRMKKLGDIASSLGAGFEQTAEAFKDLMVGQTKRIEEIGISAQQSNGKIQLSFKGVNVEIEKNAEGVQKALDIYSQLNGVLGTSDAVAKTLGGRISALSDAWKNLLLTFGNESGSLMGSFIVDATNFLNIISHADLSAGEKFKMIFGSWDGAGEELKKVNDELAKNNKLHQDRVMRMATEAIKDYGFNLEKIAAIYANPIFTEDVLAEVSRRHKEQLDKEKAAAEAAAKAYEELRKAKNEALIAASVEMQQTLQASNNELNNFWNAKTKSGSDSIDSFVPEEDAPEQNLGSGLSDAALKAAKKRLLDYQEYVTQIKDLNAQLRDSFIDLGINVLEIVGTKLGNANMNIGQGLKIALGKFMSMIGGMFIKFALASKAFQNLMKNILNPVAPGLLLAAGAALVIAGSAIVATASKGMGGSGGGVGGGGSAYSGGRGSVNANTQSEQRLVIQVVAKGNDLVGVYDSAKSSQVIRRGG